MATETVTLPDTKPELADGPPKDRRLRHYVERLSPKGVNPAVFSDVALCGAKVTDLVEHNGDICQPCVDESRRRPREG